MQSGVTNDFRSHISSRIGQELSIDDCALIEELCGMYMDIYSSPFDERVAELIGDFGRGRTATPASEETAMG